MIRMIRRVAVSSISMALFIIFTPLSVLQNLWCGLVLRRPECARPGIVEEVYAKVLCTVEEALRNILPEAEEIEEDIRVLTGEQKRIISEQAGVKFDSVFDREHHFFIGRRDGLIIGYAVKDTVKGKWGPIRYMVSLDPGGSVIDAMVLEYKERRGRPVAKRRFLKQFSGKTQSDRIRLKKDIRGVSGATISSRGMTDGIRKLVHVFNELYAEDQ